MSPTRARIALYGAQIGLLVLIAGSYPRVGRLTDALAAVICAGAVLLLYGEDRARLRSPLRGREAVLALIGVSAVAMLLGLAALSVLY